MIHSYYKWRYRRSQNVNAFTLPRSDVGRSPFGINFGSYLSQPAVRGSDFGRFTLPNKRRRWLRALCALTILASLAWLIHESIAALSIF